MILEWLRRLLPHRCQPVVVEEHPDGSVSRRCVVESCRRKVDWDELEWPVLKVTDTINRLDNP